MQGMTLRPIMQHLRLPEDNSVEEETALARTPLTSAGQSRE